MKKDIKTWSAPIYPFLYFQFCRREMDLKMKRSFSTKIIMVFTILSFSLTATLPFFAESSIINIVDEVMVTKDFYRQNKPVLDDWQETIVCAATKILDNNITPAIPEITEENKNSAATYAKIILAALAQGKNPKTEDFDPVAKLISMQAENGSFGDIYSHIYCVFALDASKASYNSEEAVNFILSQKLPDGGFSYESATEGDLDTTGLVLTALAKYKDASNVKEAIDDAKEFIHSKQQENGGFIDDNSNTLSVCIQGLVDIGETVNSDYWRYMPMSLIRFKNSDGSYKYALTDDDSYNAYATTQALMALHAIGTGSSPFKTLIDKGGFSLTYTFEDFKPIIITFLILASLSVVFWVFIMFRKDTVIHEDTEK